MEGTNYLMYWLGLVVEFPAKKGSTQLGNVNLLDVLGFVVTSDGVWHPRHLVGGSTLTLVGGGTLAVHGGYSSPCCALCCRRIPTSVEVTNHMLIYIISYVTLTS